MQAEAWVPTDTFGARLALIRQAKGWNVRQAAEAGGVPEQRWHDWEAGRSPRGMDRVARQIAERVGVDYVWLLAGGPLRSRCFMLTPGISDPRYRLAASVL